MASTITESIKSVVKLLFQTGSTDLPKMRKLIHSEYKDKQDKEAVILGNGPSLNETISTKKVWLANKHLICVNFFANSPYFNELKPWGYVLADPHFFQNPEAPNVRQLFENLNAVDWQMNLFIPRKYFKNISNLLTNKNLNILRYNPIAIEGYCWLENLCFGANRGMPRPRNVIIPAIMIGIALGFNTLYIAGADHTWTRDLSVDEDNQVLSHQPHFYNDKPEEQRRIASIYKGKPFHKVLENFMLVFKGYHRLAEYSAKKHVEIFNITPGSFIDAFPRK